MLKKILIIGGTSGLGLELARMYNELGHTVFITGRTDPQISDLKFIPLAINQNINDNIEQINNALSGIKEINTIIYAAGFYQEGRIDKLEDDEILKMVNVGLTVPALLIKRLKNNPGKPLKIILITSSSQYTPRELEPMYTATKAALGMLGESLSLDPEIGKVLVIAPSGMKTSFWDDGKDTVGYLAPKWVAEKIVEISSGPFKYRYARILRNPEKVEIIKTR